MCKLQTIPPVVQPKRQRPSHAGGPINRQYAEDHIAKFEIMPVDADTGKPLLAAAAAKSRVHQRYFTNPQTTLDAIAMESLLGATLLGPISNALIRFLVGDGLKIEIKLLNPQDMTAEEQQAEIKKYQHVLDRITSVTDQITANNDTSWTDKITQLVAQVVQYGRGALLYDSAQNPRQVKLIQGREMGITEVSEDGANFESVQIQWLNNQVSKDDLLYLVDPVHTSSVYASGVYGLPLIRSAIPDARALLKVPEAMSEMMVNAYAGAYVLAVRPQGQTMESKASEYQGLIQHMKPASSIVLMESKEDLEHFDLNWAAEFDGVEKTGEYLKRSLIQHCGLPLALITESSNRASLIGKIQLVQRTTIIPIRMRLCRQINRQFYARHLALLFPDLVEKIAVEMSFNEMPVASWLDLVQSALALDSRAELTSDAMGSLIGLPSYGSLLSDNAVVVPGGNSKKLPNESNNEKGES